MTDRTATVPREVEVLVGIVGLLTQAHPADRRMLAEAWRADALHEVLDLPSAAALVWLAGHLQKMAPPVVGRMITAAAEKEIAR